MRKNIVEEKSCWGCGPDWKALHGDDITSLYIYGEEEWICPDCYDELPEDYDVDGLNMN